ncbi:MAG: flagellar basal body rod protein FlgC [Phycisphaerales bacterium]|jgi:flagellar basal-body rod protein FlgC|nr:flagellar basal body rod protein FlgC [Phycisphaerales bacterium]
MFDILDVGASGLQAQRVRMDTIAANILNINTTRNEKGEKIPFRRRFVTMAAGMAGNRAKPGVHARIEIDKTPFRTQYEPGHPDADANGYVKYPNIDLAIEQVNAMEASRAYEANVTMMEVTKAMLNSSLRLIA